jgi:hypothetical protein
MIFSYSLDLEDFLTFQLYTTSKSERVRRKRLGSRIFVPLVYLMFAAVFIVQHNYVATIAISTIAVLWYFLYPKWEQKRYVRQFTASIQENFGDALGRTGSIEFTKNELIAKDAGQEARIATNEIKEFNQISNYLMIKLKNGHSFIFPEKKIENWTQLMNIVVKLSTDLSIPFHIELDWKWH